jgi:hypothetical protein
LAFATELVRQVLLFRDDLQLGLARDAKSHFVLSVGKFLRIFLLKIYQKSQKIIKNQQKG